MLTQSRRRLMIMVALVIGPMIIALTGLPYNTFNWKNALAAYGGPPSGGGVNINVPLENGQYPPLLTITCNTPAYDAPGGNELPDKIFAGQTFYQFGAIQADAQGSFWVGLFIGSTKPAYIPIACAGGLAAVSDPASHQTGTRIFLSCRRRLACPPFILDLNLEN